MLSESLMVLEESKESTSLFFNDDRDTKLKLGVTLESLAGENSQLKEDLEYKLGQLQLLKE